MEVLKLLHVGARTIRRMCLTNSLYPDSHLPSWVRDVSTLHYVPVFPHACVVH